MPCLLLRRPVWAEKRLGQPRAVVADADLERFIFQFSRFHRELSVRHAGKTVQDRVFRQRLEHHLGDHARKQRLRHGLLVGKAVGQADALDLHIPPEDLQLLFQRHKLVRQDAEAQDVGQVRRHQRDLRHLIDLADPLHRVQRVAQKVRVQLRLQHPDLRVVERLLIFQQRLLVAAQGEHHAVELLGKLAELVAPVFLNGDLHLQIVLPDLRDRVMEPSDGPEHLPAELQTQENAHRHAAQRAERAHRI